MRLRGLLESELRGLQHWNQDLDRRDFSAQRQSAEWPCERSSPRDATRWG